MFESKTRNFKSEKDDKDLMEIKRAMARKISENIKSRGFNQKEGAKFLGVYEIDISNCVRGRVEGVTFFKLFRFLKKLNIPFQFVIGNPDYQMQSMITNYNYEIDFSRGYLVSLREPDEVEDLREYEKEESIRQALTQTKEEITFDRILEYHTDYVQKELKVAQEEGFSLVNITLFVGYLQGCFSEMKRKFLTKS